MKPLIKSNQYKTCLNFKQTDYLKFNAYLYDNLNFSSIESFIDYVHNGINICVPVHKIKISGSCSPTYLSNEYFRVSRLRDEIYHNYLVTRKKSKLRFFKKLRGIANKIAKNDKINFYKKKLINSFSNPKKMWSTLNSFIKPVNENIICKIKKDDVFVNDKRMISNLFIKR